ncbi:acyl-CoA desaturase [Alcanivorax sp. JB21]|uniref:fatty acid desaturase family protein n=1 Tax=Alcanivorax limicola TaxID=2874102 RepID=UPI001CBB0B51|nr:acyl-CoA desaturase [Alcanivorax limicola]MBZ2188576.1 acyl-CoA desaturase [Alcanivorax limicola]
MNAAVQNLTANTTPSRGWRHLSAEQVEAFGAELEAIREEVMNSLGERDVKYIRRILKTQRYSEIAGRTLLFAGFLPPAWIAGTALLSLSKILENMEIGHNVMHGQWDWLKDPALNSSTYDWDNTCPAEQWKHSHNYMHHTFTNIVGKDRDVGYGIMRMSDDQPWKPQYLFQPFYNWILASFFQWGVALHDVEFERIGRGKSLAEATTQLKQIWKKARKQVFKDYLLFPALAGPGFLFTLAGNATANLVRNLWSYMVIFCGHFTEGVEMFSEEEVKDETRSQWYLRQLLGSSNLEGGRAFHILTGHLSHQIEHHLFPDMPAHRYAEIGPRVQAICERYNLPYNTGTLPRQFATVLKRINRLALPGRRRQAAAA